MHVALIGTVGLTKVLSKDAALVRVVLGDAMLLLGTGGLMNLFSIVVALASCWRLSVSLFCRLHLTDWLSLSFLLRCR